MLANIEKKIAYMETNLVTMVMKKPEADTKACIVTVESKIDNLEKIMSSMETFGDKH